MDRAPGRLAAAAGDSPVSGSAVGLQLLFGRDDAFGASAFFGSDKASFQLASPVTGTTRSYTRFTDVLHDTIDARIWLGIHFRKADVDGVWLGKNVAKWVDKHFFEPVH